MGNISDRPPAPSDSGTSRPSSKFTSFPSHENNQLIKKMENSRSTTSSAAPHLLELAMFQAPGGNDSTGDKSASGEKYSPEMTKRLIEQGQNGTTQAERNEAWKKLGQMGPDAIKDLEKFMQGTSSLDAYKNARNAVANIKANSASESGKSAFSEPYNKAGAAKLIEQLGSDKAVERERASDTLFKMGPDALGDLQAATKSGDPEVARRAREAIRSIENQAKNEKLGHYTAGAQSVEKLLGKAGIEVDKQQKQIADPDGKVTTIGPTQVIGDPSGGKLSNEDRKSFEDMIKRGDELSKDKQFDDLLKEMKGNDWDSYVKLSTAGMAREGRQHYARALSGSTDPADQKKGRELLMDQMKRNPDEKPGWSFTDTAARLGAHNDPKFVEAFKKAGGDVEKLKEQGEEYERRRKEKER